MLALIIGGLGALLALGAAAIGLASRPFAASSIYVAAATISAALALFGAIRLVLLPVAPPETLLLPLGLPGLGCHFRLDDLAGFFLVVVNAPAAAVALFAVGYTKHEHAQARVLPLYPIFVAGMNAVLIADDAFTFLFAWEFMSLVSWALILANHRDPEAGPAARLYLVLAAFGTLCLMLAFGALAGPSGHYDFVTLRAARPTPLAAAAVALFALLGTGSKAGLIPLHAWLPLAHAAAPAPVSALMSGVMTKVALYGLIRILFELAGPLPWGWGAALTLIGGASAVLGLLYALLQTDIKRLLAFSTVENLGIAAIGLGLALMFRATGQTGMAALALTAGLFHALNHALFKSLLFCGAGAIAAATGTRDLERLGGLAGRAKLLALACLIGCAAIAGLPPFNGFVSEWLTLQAILSSPRLPEPLLRLALPIVGALLALTIALAAICFLRVFGIAFLGRARSPEAAAAQPVAPALTWPLLGLGAACLLLGVMPVIGFALTDPVVRALGNPSFIGASAVDWLTTMPEAARQTGYSGLALVLTATLLGVLTLLALRRLSPIGERRSVAWDCGFPETSTAAQYTASSFAQPMRRVFSPLFRVRETLDMPSPLDPRPAIFRVTWTDPLWQALYRPPARLVAWLTETIDRVQFLTIRRNLSLTFGTLVLLLVIVALGT
jgi:formate hydrogenlyase subunit 3/multisubunit Na+/H+ antiporter MnhD subunit